MLYLRLSFHRQSGMRGCLWCPIPIMSNSQQWWLHRMSLWEFCPCHLQLQLWGSFRASKSFQKWTLCWWTESRAVVIIVFMSGVAWYTGHILGRVKLRYPQIHSMSDAGGIFFGRFARQFLSVGQLIFLIFLMASHVLTFSVLMNELTDHGACTIGFSVVGLVVSFLGSMPRRMEKVYWISVICKWSLRSIQSDTDCASLCQYPHRNDCYDDCYRSSKSGISSPSGCDQSWVCEGISCSHKHSFCVQYDGPMFINVVFTDND